MKENPVTPPFGMPSSQTTPPTQVSLTPFQSALRSKDFEVLKNLRHTLRTPLNQIIGYSEMVMESLDDIGSPLLRDLKKIHTAGGQLLALFNDSLAPWKIETGKIDLLLMRREALTPLNAIIGYGEICEEEATGASRPDLCDDIKKINIAAWNLHHIFECGEYPEKLEIGSSSADLGLAAVTVLGQTTSSGFTAPPMDFLSGAKSKVAGRLLVVDDDAANCEMLSRRLQRLGYHVMSAENGRVALDMLRQKPFDLVLLDILMPELNGFQTLEFIKTDVKLRNLPVIMLTALDEVDSTVRCIEAGAEDYVPKPFNPVILQARIAASLEKKRLRDQETAFLSELQAERGKTERLLLNTLPKAIADRLKAGEGTIVDSFREATVIFADIVGFTRISASMAPSRTVQLLNEIFSSFDRLAETHQIEKIKTIGDSYMAVGGVPTYFPQHAEACADLALEMLIAMKGLNRRHQLDWDIRIGLNSGPLVAGIIGTKKFSYDLWGDTVNVASRMESHGTPGRIQVSEPTYRLLVDRYVFEERGEVEMKNRGSMQVYHLMRRKA